MEKQNLKILMIAPLSSGIVHGGVRKQASSTVHYLKELGMQVDTFDPWSEYQLESYDLVHLFLAGNETLTIAKRLRDEECKLVLSPVFYTRRSAKTIRNSMRIESIAGQYFRGLFSDYSIKSSVCHCADLILPNTTAESLLIRDGFGVSESRLRVIPNGVDLRFKDAKPDLFHSTHNIRNFTLFVGDASAVRKNVLKLLREHTAGDQPLVLIGKFDSSDYSAECLRLIHSGENVHHLGPLKNSDPMLASAYAAASVFTLPSQFETPGIAALEAALAGCKIAITEVGGTREVFGEYAEYINPEKSGSAIRAIRNAYKRQDPSDLSDKIAEHYSWKSVAEQTLMAYKTLF